MELKGSIKLNLLTFILKIKNSKGEVIEIPIKLDKKPNLNMDEMLKDLMIG